MGYHSIQVFFHQRMVDYIAGSHDDEQGNGIIQWIDDTLIHAVGFDHFMKILEDVLANLIKWKVRISPSKSIVFTKSIEYCGRDPEDPCHIIWEPDIDDYATTTDEETETRAGIRSLSVNLVHLRPKKQVENRTYTALKSLDKYRVSVFNAYLEGEWRLLEEVEIIRA
eukprot:augustus_masked-scaffold_1-processed-gene-32.62-mRNA-1 protein AED:1.00 eAED:1.00 QI:0/0/0/0/1/1/2/0/167